MKNDKNSIHKRQLQLLHLVKETGSGDVTEMALALKVSPITIRRDLKLLEEKGQVARFFGGAKIVPQAEAGEEPPYIAGENTAQKLAIARRAAEMLEDGDTVFINSSSTALLIYPFLREKSIVVITNNGRSLLVQRNAGVELVLTGGEVYGEKQSLVGEFALNALSRVTSTKCILGVSGISVEGGITSRVIQETAINQMMLRRCKGPKIIVADSEKIGLEHNFYSGKISDVTHLITDSGANPAELASIREAGIEVILVEA